ncbi:MAG: hypothetical protein Q4B96_01070 [Bacillota bacterium]|nr:hypothetical protein [Bacillota bacterium]
MLIKLLGALCVIVSAVALGRCKAAQFSSRRRQLAGLQGGLLSLEQQISYTAAPLPQALAEAAQAADTAGGLFAAAAGHLQRQDGLTAGEAWLLALEQSELQQRDRQLLTALAAGFGHSDGDGQLSQVALLRERVAAAERQAAEEEQRLGKIWRSMGWAIGSVLVLLLA